MPAVEPPPREPITEPQDDIPPLKVPWVWDSWFRRLSENLPKNRRYKSALSSFSSVGSNTTSEQTKTVTGLDVNDWVHVNKPTHQTGLGIVGARVSAANTIAITFQNTTGSGITPDDETYKIYAVRF